MNDESATRLSLLLRVRDLTDEGAWRDFVECYAPRVYQWCCRLGLQEADAADVAQSVLLKLVSGLQSFEYLPQRGRFRGWLKTVTRHVVCDLERQSRSRGWDCFAESSGVVDRGPSPADQLHAELEAAHQAELLRTATVNVQPRFSKVNWRAYELTCQDGLAAPEVARQLGMTIAEVYVAKSRILKSLRAEVQRLEELL